MNNVSFGTLFTCPLVSRFCFQTTFFLRSIIHTCLTVNQRKLNFLISSNKKEIEAFWKVWTLKTPEVGSYTPYPPLPLHTHTQPHPYPNLTIPPGKLTHSYFSLEILLSNLHKFSWRFFIKSWSKFENISILFNFPI